MQYLDNSKFFVDYDGKHKTRHKEEDIAEGVMLLVVCAAILVPI
jgi:hypothetical protein